MKTKKSISLILAIVMLLAMVSGAWAAAIITADGVAKGPADGASGDITEVGDALYILYALNPNGSITYTGGTIRITGDVVGDTSKGGYASNFGKIMGTGNIVAAGESIQGLSARQSGDITWTGDISATGNSGRGVSSVLTSSVDVIGKIQVEGTTSRAFYVGDSAYGRLSGDVVVYGNSSTGIHGTGDALVNYTGNITASGDTTHGAVSFEGSTVLVTGSVSVLGPNSYGILATRESFLTMKNGSLAVGDNTTSFAVYVGANGTVNLENVTIECENLLKSGSASTSAEGMVNISGGSVLAGNILHTGTTDDTLAVNVTDSTWDGAAEASGDIGTIDINLEGSDWNVTGDSNTNGKVTADEDSNIDFRGTDENIVVEIDSLAGAPGLNIKLGDELIIKNQTGNTPSTTTPDIISIVENPDGSISIIPKGDGTGNLTYQYVDDNGDIQTVTIGVVSGSGVKPAGGGGGSSGCNAGFGVLALMGLTFVYKKK